MVWLKEIHVGDRFKKPGRMLDADWARLEEWLKENAIPRKESQPPALPKTRFNKGKMTPAQRAKHEEWLKKNTNPRIIKEPKEPKRIKKPINELMPRVKILSSPRLISEKYSNKSCEPPIIKKSTLNYVATKRVKLLSIPRYITEKVINRRKICLPNVSTVSAAALHYQATPHITELARPRSVPVGIYEKPKRVFSDKKDREFFLKNRTKPKNASKDDDDMQKKRKFKTLKELAPGIEKLSKPRETGHKYTGSSTFSDPLTKVKKSALNAKPSPAIDTLSKPRLPIKNGPEKPWEPTVSKKALKAVATERINKLAKPKTDWASIEEKKYKKKKSKMWRMFKC